MLAVRDLSIAFKGRTILDGLTFEAARGEVVTLVAANGGGKSTTFRILAGAVLQDSGHVDIDGRRQEPGRGRVPVSFASADRTIWPGRVPREVLQRCGELYGLGRAEARARVQGICERLGMQPFIDGMGGRLSTGEAMKLTFARTLLADNDLVILDEPTAGLDHSSAQAMEREIAGLRAAGRCVLLSTHRIEEVSRLSDRVLVMSAGLIVTDIDAVGLRTELGDGGATEALVRRAEKGWS
jgi:ABC-type multidrug transport system ATPase subunit